MLRDATGPSVGNTFLCPHWEENDAAPCTGEGREHRQPGGLTRESNPKRRVRARATSLRRSTRHRECGDP